MAKKNKRLYEILVPKADNNGKSFSRAKHKAWDAKAMAMSGGLTKLATGVGQWAYEGKVYRERMTPVRVALTPAEIESLSAFTAEHYKQLAVMFYEVSANVTVRSY